MRMCENAPPRLPTLWQRAMILASLKEFSTGVYEHWSIVTQGWWPPPEPTDPHRATRPCRPQRLIAGVLCRSADSARRSCRNLVGSLDYLHRTIRLILIGMRALTRLTFFVAYRACCGRSRIGSRASIVQLKGHRAIRSNPGNR
jgi:hypothetical protein